MLILAGAIGLVAALRILVHVKPVRFVWHTLLLKIPVMGQIIADTELALLCRNLGVMIKSGMPITVALDIQYSNSENMVYKNYIALIKEEVAHGKSMADQFSHSLYPGIPPIMEKMVGVGDRTGKLDEILLYLSNFFEDEVDVATKNISIVLEPVLLFVITAIVGFVAMAIIMPIYQLTGSIK
jgi:type II secretory pathway component PulF